ncbi:hypothetical protein Val02_70020 [Virgisporangium aliadipatigenens]|uniref:DUF3152 domain-containing protein n=1 Tax=Virgisporangium aliadipatigenens TaxID=741659 RepID=A0A8J3YRH8_9ACTN|nr:hypothetical protein Val02_70020 [Virgisporangium aliadipatigenens]
MKFFRASLFVVAGLLLLGYVFTTRMPGSAAPGLSAPQPSAPPAEPAFGVQSPAASPVAPSPPHVPYSGPQRFEYVRTDSAPVGAGRIWRYRIAVEETSGVAPEEFAQAVERILAERRSWIAKGNVGFRRVAADPSDLTIHLATPATTDKLCSGVGVQTKGEVSCRGGRTIVINLARWQLAVPWYADARDEYRAMVVNHEVGHFLGNGHVRCPRPGGLAPVMQTQTYGLEGCVRNPWPYPDGKTLVTGPVGSD